MTADKEKREGLLLFLFFLLLLPVVKGERLLQFHFSSYLQ